MSSSSVAEPAVVPAASWDPAALLELRNPSKWDNLTCKGIASSTGLRCKWGPQANCNQDCPLEDSEPITDLVRRLRSLTLSAAAQDDRLLLELARAMLCSKFHQHQATSISRHWQRSIQAEARRLGATAAATRPTDANAEIARLSALLSELRVRASALQATTQTAEAAARAARSQAQEAEDRAQQAEQRAEQADQLVKQADADAEARRARLATESAAVARTRRELDEERARLDQRRERFEEQRDMLEAQRRTLATPPSTPEKEPSRWWRSRRSGGPVAGEGTIATARMPDVPQAAPGVKAGREGLRTRVTVAAVN